MLNNAPTPSADTLTNALRKSYDDLPYDNLPRYTTHPDCLATAARLRGLEVPPVATARVLELGCSTGVNLIALAVAIPGGHYTGIDLSAAHIDAAVSLAKNLGLEQVNFAAADLRSVAGALGEFDYIVCHGVYSHVPADVQEAILSICAHSLAPNGVACVSYNTYPGWYMRGMIRDLLRWRVRDLTSESRRVSAAREFLSLLAQHAHPPKSPYAALLDQEQRMLEESAETYLVHEHLDPVNEPFYLTDFVARARSHGLEYVGDAEPDPQPEDLPAGLGAAVSAHSDDPLERDQYLDFFHGRTFRGTVLCHSDARPRHLSAVEAVAGLVVRARAAPGSDQPRIMEIALETFRTRDGQAVESNDPFMKALLLALYRRAPRMVDLPTLRDDILTLLAGAWPGYRPEDPAPLAEALLRFHRGKILRLQTLSIPFAAEASARPLASPLARFQAGSGPMVTNLRHDNLKLDDTERSLLGLLDGTRDRRALLSQCPGLDAGTAYILLSRMATHALLHE